MVVNGEKTTVMNVKVIARLRASLFIIN